MSFTFMPSRVKTWLDMSPDDIAFKLNKNPYDDFVKYIFKELDDTDFMHRIYSSRFWSIDRLAELSSSSDFTDDFIFNLFNNSLTKGYLDRVRASKLLSSPKFSLSRTIYILNNSSLEDIEQLMKTKEFYSNINKILMLIVSPDLSPDVKYYMLRYMPYYPCDYINSCMKQGLYEVTKNTFYYCPSTIVEMDLPGIYVAYDFYTSRTSGCCSDTPLAPTASVNVTDTYRDYPWSIEINGIEPAFWFSGDDLNPFYNAIYLGGFTIDASELVGKTLYFLMPVKYENLNELLIELGINDSKGTSRLDYVLVYNEDFIGIGFPGKGYIDMRDKCEPNKWCLFYDNISSRISLPTSGSIVFKIGLAAFGFRQTPPCNEFINTLSEPNSWQRFLGPKGRLLLEPPLFIY